MQLFRASAANKLPATDVDCAAKLSAIFNTNAFEMEGSVEGVSEGLSGVCILASRINHSCLPCANHRYNAKQKTYAIYASRDIEVDEEITIAYVPPTQSREVRRADLRKSYGFDCMCKACDLSTGFGKQSARNRAKIEELQAGLKASRKPGVRRSGEVEPLRRVLGLLEEERLGGGYEAERYVPSSFSSKDSVTDSADSRVELAVALKDNDELPQAVAEMEIAVELMGYNYGKDTVYFAKIQENLEGLRRASVERR